MKILSLCFVLGLLSIYIVIETRDDEGLMANKRQVTQPEYLQLKWCDELDLTYP